MIKTFNTFFNTRCLVLGDEDILGNFLTMGNFNVDRFMLPSETNKWPNKALWHLLVMCSGQVR